MMDVFLNIKFPIAIPVVIAALLFYILRRWSNLRSRGGLPFPPGPKPDPLIGNLRQIPQVSPWLKYAEWGKNYGPVVSVEALGTRIVIVNSAKAAADLFDKRGTIYSDRPSNVMIKDLMKDVGTTLEPYSDAFRAQRKLMHSAFNLSAVVDYYHIQERESYALLDRLLESPDKFYRHVKRTSGSIITTIAYGHVVTTDDDYFVQLSETALAYFLRALQPASFLVNVIPALKYIPAWMPFTGFHKVGLEGRDILEQLRDKPFEMVKEKLREGTAANSYTSRLLEAKGSVTSHSSEEEFIKITAATLYGAGVDTTVSAIVTFILAMVLYPDVQRKAQAEIDDVVGNGRLPTLSDRPSLPYLNCVLYEVFRWNPVSALGIPHALSQDDVYEGSFIPKEAVVLSNIWAMTHDESTYPEPMKFWPERYDGRSPRIKDPTAFVFGFGRRVCPGRHLALNSVFIIMASLLAAYDFRKVLDADGKEIDPVADFSSGAPAPFDCRITPRSKESVSLIRKHQTEDWI